MSEKRLVRLYIGGQISPLLAETLVEKINKISGVLDDYWSAPSRDVDQLVAYAVKEKWVGLRHEDWPQAFEELEEWLQERRIPYDEHLPPFGELPGVIAYYRPPSTRVSRNCDFYGNPVVEWEEAEKVLHLLRARRPKQAREALEGLLGQEVGDLSFFEVVP